MKTVRFEMRLDPSEKREWERVAAMEHYSLSAWFQKVARREARSTKDRDLFDRAVAREKKRFRMELERLKLERAPRFAVSRGLA